MPEQHFDVLVIGGGPAGYASALYGASAGLNVGLVEKHKVGGTCLLVGCIPAKALLETATVARTVRHSEEFGIAAGELAVNWADTLARKQGIVDKLVGGLSGMLGQRKVTVFDGRGQVASVDGEAKVVSIGGGSSGDIEVSADNLILAAGSVPRTLDGFPIDDRQIVTSDEFLSLPSIPASAVVIGGGAIGCEFASVLSDLGSEVTILEYAPKILPGCDTDVTKIVERSFKKRGIKVHAGVAVKSQVTGPSGVEVTFGDDQKITAETVVMSVGRRPASETLGLGDTGIEVDDRGFIRVDAYCRTAVPGVWAVGDVVDTAQLAHVAFAEAIVAIKDILGESPVPVDYSKVPWCIYCYPEVAFVGYTEDAAKEAGYEVVVSKHRFAANGRAMIVGEADGIVKIVAEKQPDGTGGRILGVHMVGPWVTEQLGQGYLAVNWEATVDEVAQFIQPHPTMSEVFGETVLSLTGRSLH